MTEKSFYNDLVKYLRECDNENANFVIMRELGNILVKDRESFIVLLNYSGVPAYEQDTDADLIEKLIENIGNNRRLIVGTSFLINQHNKKVGFDGTEEISDAGVKAVHKVMYNYFCGASRERKSSANGVADAITATANLASKGLDVRASRKNLGSDALRKKQEAQSKILDSVLEQRAAQRQLASEKEKAKSKTKKILLISAASLIGVALIIGGVYLYKKAKG